MSERTTDEQIAKWREAFAPDRTWQSPGVVRLVNEIIDALVAERARIAAVQKYIDDSDVYDERGTWIVDVTGVDDRLNGDSP